MRYRVRPGFDERLAWAIEQHRFLGTLPDLNVNAGYPKHTIENWLKGMQPKITSLEPRRFNALCRLLGVSPNWLRWDEGEP